jgi:glycosyltransferase involved in cell wall biosynthesis
VVGDDGCNPELRAWAEGVAATDPRVRYAKTPERVGLAGNWNFVAAHARGEFVTIIGDDDRLLPDFAGQMLSQATASVAVVFANHYVIDGAGQRKPDASAITRQYGRDRLAAGPLANPAAAVWRNSIAMSACAVRTSDVRRLQFKTDINTPELEFFARLALESPVFVFVPDYLAEYRSHKGSATARGLTIDRLAEYLEPIEVADDLEVVKRNLLQPMVTAGVGIRLARGDIDGARRLAMSRYYRAGPRALLQRICLAFPGPISTHAYASAARVGRLLRRGAGTRGA